MSKLQVKFLIDKEQKRVVFAEAGRDFVDVLFSFLALPLGSIVRLLNKQSGLGSLDSLYESVEQLDTKHLQTVACREMLLNPRSAAAVPCEDLKIKNIHQLKPRICHTCSNNGCLVLFTCYYTYTSTSTCWRCGKLMDKNWEWGKAASDEGGVFLNDTSGFMITDDLRVKPASIMMGFSLIKELQISDESVLEERVIDFDTEEALTLLRRSLVSNNALTGVCFPDSCIQSSADCSSLLKREMVEDEAENEVSIKLVLYMENNNVLCAEVAEDFVNELFSFLTFPLGSVLGFLSYDVLPSGCINNLYSSALHMSLFYFKSDLCKYMLVTPKLATFYGIGNQMLELEEDTSKMMVVNGSCVNCYQENGCKECTSSSCKHGKMSSRFMEQNPKAVKGVAGSGAVLVPGSRKFMVADNLRVSPPSFISSIGRGLKLPTSNLVIKEVSVDESKAIAILGAMLSSKTVLTDVFCSKPQKRMRIN